MDVWSSRLNTTQRSRLGGVGSIPLPVATEMRVTSVVLAKDTVTPFRLQHRRRAAETLGYTGSRCHYRKLAPSAAQIALLWMMPCHSTLQ